MDLGGELAVPETRERRGRVGDPHLDGEGLALARVEGRPQVAQVRAEVVVAAT